VSDTETVITTAGDTVDLIAFHRFGAHGAEQAIYDANPGLVDQGPILPAGLSIIVPVPGVADRTSTSNRLWA
jgi:phage tail protein X